MSRIYWKIKQGETFKRAVGVFEDDRTTPVDLTGFSAKMQVRKNADAELLADAGIDIAGNVINITIPKNQTMNFPEGEVMFDLDLIKNNEVFPLVRQGKIQVIKNINE